MTYEEALTVLKRGGQVTRGGKTFVLRPRGIHDVTGEEPERVYMNEDDRAATDWEEGAAIVVGEPEVVAPETVDEALSESEQPQ